ncbi:MAG: sulfurtransferase [Rubellimicrobium sp.]|nr:sulfurtransferase [Rubellimicrobium sp.]
MFSFLRRPAEARPDPAELVRMAQAGEAIVIDIREPGEVRMTGKAACALHIPMATLRTKCDPACNECAPELKNDLPVILYCASGARAAMAARLMKQLGHKQVWNLGGLSNWQAAGGKIGR